MIPAALKLTLERPKVSSSRPVSRDFRDLPTHAACRTLGDSLRGLGIAATLTAGRVANESVESAESWRAYEGQMVPDGCKFPI